MTELHLDRDEWGAIFEAVVDFRERIDPSEKQYREYLDNIILKLEIALTPEEWEDAS